MLLDRLFRSRREPMECGLNLWDTAAVYGEGTSERILGNLAQIKRVNEILGAEGLRVSAVQNHFSLLHRSSERAGILNYCKENNITFYAYMVLEQGAYQSYCIRNSLEIIIMKR